MQRAINAASLLSFGGMVFLALSLWADERSTREAVPFLFTATSLLFVASASVGILTFLKVRPTDRPVRLAVVRILWGLSIPLFWLLVMVAAFADLVLAALLGGAAFFATLAAIALSFMIGNDEPDPTDDSRITCSLCGLSFEGDAGLCPNCFEGRSPSDWKSTREIR